MVTTCESVSTEGSKDGMLHSLLLPTSFWLVREVSMIDVVLTCDSSSRNNKVFFLAYSVDMEWRIPLLGISHAYFLS